MSPTGPPASPPARHVPADVPGVGGKPGDVRGEVVAEPDGGGQADDLLVDVHARPVGQSRHVRRLGGRRAGFPWFAFILVPSAIGVTSWALQGRREAAAR